MRAVFDTIVSMFASHGHNVCARVLADADRDRVVVRDADNYGRIKSHAGFSLTADEAIVMGHTLLGAAAALKKQPRPEPAEAV